MNLEQRFPKDIGDIEILNNKFSIYEGNLLRTGNTMSDLFVVGILCFESENLKQIILNLYNSVKVEMRTYCISSNNNNQDAPINIKDIRIATP